MRRVLLLAHHFPPVGGVVGRNVALARWLPEFGYQPVVLTGPGGRTGRWAPSDPGFGDRVADVEVIRVTGPIPPDRSGTSARLARWLEQPAPWERWWAAAAAQAGRRLGGFDVLLANCIPYETAFAASSLSMALGAPWVADLEDPWALDEMRVAPTALNYRTDLARMRRGLATASALIMNCDEAAARVRRELPSFRHTHVTSVPHGFTDDDFRGPAAPRHDDAFRIVHTGSFHTELGYEHRSSARLRRVLHGSSLDLDILPRSPLHLFEAIARLASAEPRRAASIEVHLVGALTPADRELAARHPFVHTYGQMPHGATIAMARSADLLFLPMYDLPLGRRAGIVPCKTYEYLAAERPILAAVPDGDARDLLSRFGRVSVVRPTDVDGMANAIRDRMLRPDRHVDHHGRGDEPLRRYERRELTGRIAATLDVVVGADTARGRVADSVSAT